MKKKILNKTVGDVREFLRANRKASREEEFRLLGPGFHSKTVVIPSKKVYSKKLKHKGGEY